MKEEMLKRAAAILEKEFGPDWQGIAQELGTENLRKRREQPVAGQLLPRGGILHPALYP